MVPAPNFGPKLFTGKPSVRHDTDLEADCRREKSNWLAAQAGLPPVRSQLTSQFGIRWEVISHASIPTTQTLARWRSGGGNQLSDLYPAVEPLNLSDRLIEFISAIDRCTTKRFTILHTMPEMPGRGHFFGDNCIDTVCHPEVNFVLLDAARMPETIIAHEFGHAWIQYVDGCEDFRTLVDPSNPSRLRMLNYLQSIVLDLKVNDLIRKKGFDMSPIETDEQAALNHWARASAAGYRPEYLGEEVFMATAVATEIFRREQGSHAALVRKDDPLPAIREKMRPIFELAVQMAASISSAGYASRTGVLRAIDECLVIAFAHCGEQIDVERDLVAKNPPEPDVDKYPSWLPPLSPRSKCDVGRYMAHNDISSEWRSSLEPSPTGHARVSFNCPNNMQYRSMVIDEPLGPPTRYSPFPKVLAEVMLMHDEAEARRRATFAGFPSFPTFPNPNRPMEQNLPNPAATWPSAPPAPHVPRRHYTAGAARFCAMVREAEWIGGEHPYAYAMNNPTTYTDSTGDAPDVVDVTGPALPVCRNCEVTTFQPCGPYSDGTACQAGQHKNQAGWLQLYMKTRTKHTCNNGKKAWWEIVQKPYLGGERGQCENGTVPDPCPTHNTCTPTKESN